MEKNQIANRKVYWALVKLEIYLLNCLCIFIPYMDVHSSPVHSLERKKVEKQRKIGYGKETVSCKSRKRNFTSLRGLFFFVKYVNMTSVKSHCSFHK